MGKGNRNIPGLDRLLRAFTEHLYKAAKGEKGDAVIRPPPDHPPDAVPEADGKPEDSDPEGPGHEKMAEFVDENEYAQNEEKGPDSLHVWDTCLFSESVGRRLVL